MTLGISKRLFYCENDCGRCCLPPLANSPIVFILFLVSRLIIGVSPSPPLLLDSFLTGEGEDYIAVENSLFFHSDNSRRGFAVADDLSSCGEEQRSLRVGEKEKSAQF